MDRLTAPHSGSDAASMSEAYGEVVERDGKLGMYLTYQIILHFCLYYTP